MPNKVTQRYTDHYRDNNSIIKELSSDFVYNEREKALRIFEEKGFPTRKNETYKYTDLESVFDNDLDMSVSHQVLEIDAENLFKCEVIKLDAHLALVVKGRMVSDSIQLDNGIIISSFKEASEKHSDIFNKYYNQIAQNEEDGSVAINTALALDGVFIYIPKNKTLDKPIQIVNLQIDGKQNNMTQMRHLVVAEENSEAKVIFCDDSFTCNQHLSNSVTEIFVDKNARLEVTKIQNEHNDAQNLSSTFVKQQEHSVVTSHTVSLLGGLIRNNLHMEMDGEYCEANAYGISLLDKKQKFDNHTYIHHAHPNCNSNQLYKNIVDDHAKGVFAGTVLVDKDAQQTNAFQANNNIILTDTAKMNTKPQLIIYADDVKCSHGATVGQLDENALFYMRARGIDHKDAKMLLMYAFADEVVSKISIEALRQNTEELVGRRLSGRLANCRTCAALLVEKANL